MNKVKTMSIKTFAPYIFILGVGVFIGSAVFPQTEIETVPIEVIVIDSSLYRIDTVEVPIPVPGKPVIVYKDRFDTVYLPGEPEIVYRTPTGLGFRKHYYGKFINNPLLEYDLYLDVGYDVEKFQFVLDHQVKILGEISAVADIPPRIDREGPFSVELGFTAGRLTQEEYRVTGLVSAFYKKWGGIVTIDRYGPQIGIIKRW